VPALLWNERLVIEEVSSCVDHIVVVACVCFRQAGMTLPASCTNNGRYAGRNGPMCDKDEAIGLDLRRWVPINFVPGIVHRGQHSHNVNPSASLHSCHYAPALRGCEFLVAQCPSPRRGLSPEVAHEPLAVPQHPLLRPPSLCPASLTTDVQGGLPFLTISPVRHGDQI